MLTPYRGSINEIRIEGHTSSIWNKYTAASEAYFKNMSLSQGRTRSVLEYVYGLKSSQSYLQWIRSNIAAVGLSSSKLIFDKAQREDRARSQRVSFRVITNADIQIKNILEKANED
ncbi:OmpA family protein [Endozoicomonas gorgoniicola]|uniref:OmpA family protein n=1 Tax=Endozoicomonas gorgoniicola TaxID=1234144 RepID=A0ABT3N3W7_9GAMM|nr:OmpA family protein [Endozoicomonas gorgoniicola]MCW7556033.1 OmpA family protein [Endozoicomonas gorgoniicola]